MDADEIRYLGLGEVGRRDTLLAQLLLGHVAAVLFDEIIYKD